MNEITESHEIARKLAFIARLTAEEIEGWEWARTQDGRAPFDGENAALAKRKRELGMKGA